jgi:exonuclease VII small subunit
MEKQEIKVTELKENGAVIEETMTYEKSIDQLKNEVRDLEYRKKSLYDQMIAMRRTYKSYEEKQKALKDVITKLEPVNAAPGTVDDIFENL